MAKLQILTYPESVLLKKSAPVDAVDAQIVELAQEMSKLMISAGGIGLAAPQVGVPRRLITLDIGDGLVTLVNPVIRPETVIEIRSIQIQSSAIQSSGEIIISANLPVSTNE